ncbi:gas vesicle protein [Rhodococcus sp. SGAir0479]|uniref:gas vesicle protein n=1 Tax=Rhodococcus sp. SGAir0479 TaxID=2567884 RepID=UPI0010CD027F|nr:gas vesicle protein [Rhodococcus sp. SGAir0479]QCQ91348.1 gas vesicle protein [Rhodococcus sp. SGAir0479]
MTVSGSGGNYPQQYGQGLGSGGHEPTNLGDILERVLDKGIVIAGDIRVNLLDIELLTIKLRLIVASLETAREVGIDWWEHDPWLSGSNSDLELENKRLRSRIEALEANAGTAGDITTGSSATREPAPRAVDEERGDDAR